MFQKKVEKEKGENHPKLISVLESSGEVGKHSLGPSGPPVKKAGEAAGTRNEVIAAAVANSVEFAATGKEQSTGVQPSKLGKYT